MQSFLAHVSKLLTHVLQHSQEFGADCHEEHLCPPEKLLGRGAIRAVSQTVRQCQQVICDVAKCRSGSLPISGSIFCVFSALILNALCIAEYL